MITDPITIDGYSQPGASPNTLANGDDATLLIEISGAIAPGANGLVITGGSSTIQGLIINRFNGSSAILISNKGGNVISGNFIGTNAATSAKLLNTFGVFISGSPNNTIDCAGSSLKG